MCALYVLTLSYTFFAQRNNARVIADSILNLNKEKLISNPSDDPHVTSELRTQGAALDAAVDPPSPMEVSQGVLVLCTYVYIYTYYGW